MVEADLEEGALLPTSSNIPCMARLHATKSYYFTRNVNGFENSFINNYEWETVKQLLYLYPEKYPTSFS